MDTIRTFIVDDESPARRGIRNLLNGFADAEIVGEASNGEEAVELIKKENPDLVFLDMQMPLMNGLEVIDQVGPDQFPHVIFVTAYDHYAIDAFRVHAFDYLLKPIDTDRFEKAYERVREQIGLKKLSEHRQEMKSLIQSFQSSSAEMAKTGNRLIIRDAGKVIFLKLKDILQIESSGNYVSLYIKDKSHPVLVRETMQKMEERLQEKAFLRIHRSKMINLSNVTEMEQQGDGRYIIQLVNGMSLVSSRGYKKHVEEVLDRWS